MARDFLWAHTVLSRNDPPKTPMELEQRCSACRLAPRPAYFHRINLKTRYVKRLETPREVIAKHINGPSCPSKSIVTLPFIEALKYVREMDNEKRIRTVEKMTSAHGLQHIDNGLLVRPDHSILATCLARACVAEEIAETEKKSDPHVAWAARMFAQTHFDALSPRNASRALSDRDFSCPWPDGAAGTCVLDDLLPDDTRCWHSGALPNYGNGYHFVDLFRDRGAPEREFPWVHINGKLSGRASQIREFQHTLRKWCEADASIFSWVIVSLFVGLLGGYEHAENWPGLANSLYIYTFLRAAYDGNHDARLMLLDAMKYNGALFTAVLREQMFWQISHLPALCHVMDDLGRNDLQRNAYRDMDIIRAELRRGGIQVLLSNSSEPSPELGVSLQQQQQQQQQQQLGRSENTIYHSKQQSFVDFLLKHLRSVRKKRDEGEFQKNEPPEDMTTYVQSLEPGADINLLPLFFMGVSKRAIKAVMGLQTMYYNEKTSTRAFKEVISDEMTTQDLELLTHFASLITEHYNMRVVEIDWAGFVTCQVSALCRRYGVERAEDLPPTAGILVVTPRARRIQSHLESDGEINKWGTLKTYMDVLSGKIYMIPRPGVSTKYDVAIIQGIGKIVELSHFTLSKDAQRKSGGASGRKGGSRKMNVKLAAAYMKRVSQQATANRTSPLIITPCCGQWGVFNVAFTRSTPPYYQCGHCDPAGAFDQISMRCHICGTTPKDLLARHPQRWKRVTLCRPTEDGLFRPVTVSICDMCSAPEGVSPISGPVMEKVYVDAVKRRSREIPKEALLL